MPYDQAFDNLLKVGDDIVQLHGIVGQLPSCSALRKEVVDEIHDQQSRPASRKCIPASSFGRYVAAAGLSGRLDCDIVCSSLVPRFCHRLPRLPAHFITARRSVP